MSVGVKTPEGVQTAAEMRRGLSDSGFVTSPTELALPASEKKCGAAGDDGIYGGADRRNET